LTASCSPNQEGRRDCDSEPYRHQSCYTWLNGEPADGHECSQRRDKGARREAGSAEEREPGTGADPRPPRCFRPKSPIVSDWTRWLAQGLSFVGHHRNQM
jgi:hypothetical protein